MSKDEIHDLELTPAQMREMGEQTLRAIIDHIAALPQAPRANLQHAEKIVRSLREPLPETPHAFADLLQYVMQQIIPLSINTAHPAYLGYIPGGGLYASALADFVAAATNRYVGVWYAAPAAARLEANVLEWIAGLMDYPAGSRGILTSGGSLANFSAIVTARDDRLGDDLARGTLYASNQTHHAVMKSARLAGIPERNIRLLPVDRYFRAQPDLFAEAIAADRRQGLQPFLVVANAGTTNTGAVDPLAELAELARQSDCWYHIDAAYGGFFYLCEQGRKRLHGLPLADSLVLDPHKGLFVPYGTGCLLVKEGEKLRRAHTLQADYLQDQYTPEGEWNFSEMSPELSRSFRGLRIWLPLKLYGIDAFRQNLAEKLQLTTWLYECLCAEPDIELFTPPDLSVVAFRFQPRRGDIDAFNRELLARIVRSGRLFLSSTMLNGQFAIRMCILSYRTHRAEVEEALEVVLDAARWLQEDGHRPTGHMGNA